MVVLQAYSCIHHGLRSTLLRRVRRHDRYPAAYDAYMRGMVNVSSENPADNQAAIKLFKQAVAADPNFAAAYAELSRA
jgi:uncharacterized protein with von Willebrand factor type A (vWA) domain